ncbi:MAG: hypothetical protein ACK56I_04900, partial [bacterium]
GVRIAADHQHRDGLPGLGGQACRRDLLAQMGGPVGFGPHHRQHGGPSESAQQGHGGQPQPGPRPAKSRESRTSGLGVRGGGGGAGRATIPTNNHGRQCWQDWSHFD